MNPRLIFTIIISKFLIILLRVFKRGGTTLPGKIASKMYPNIIRVLSADFKIIMVTGTNGKTTTTRIIGKTLDENNIIYITNKSGANLVSGIITTFINSVDMFGKTKASVALLEVDEAAFGIITDHIQPDILVVTNFFRDQLDRFGELYSTLNKVMIGIKKSPKAKLILNADDSLCVSLAHGTDRDIVYFGFSQYALNDNKTDKNPDAAFCIHCKTRYDYSYQTYGHLGAFCCPNCGYSRPDSQVTCLSVDNLNSAYSDILVSFGDSNNDGEINPCNVRINLPGIYNIYNALAAAALGYMLDFPVGTLTGAMSNFEHGFGRMETIKTKNKTIKIILVKNPSGFNQVLTYLLTEEQKFQISFIVNDKSADGIDISWLWDVDFEKLEKIQNHIDHFYVTGARAEDVAVRLKYAGIYSDKIVIAKAYSELLNKVFNEPEKAGDLYILPTYTAMLEIRALLRKKFRLKEFWK